MTGRSENSRWAYEAIVAHGLLGRAHLAIYRHIYANGPTTRNKLDWALCPGKPNPWPSRRLVELERMGALAVIGQDESGSHRMDIWDVTERLPEALPKRVALRERVGQLVRELYKGMSEGTVARTDELALVEKIMCELEK